MNKKIQSYLILLTFFFASCTSNEWDNTLSLNGDWELGKDQVYGTHTTVPGLAIPGDSLNPSNLWFKKEVTLPSGDWSKATLLLKGARFNPSVYVNGKLVASKKGGMAPLSFVLGSPSIKPNETVTLEISLQSLEDVKRTNASYVPEADHWRSNISSCLWDDVELRFHNALSLNRYFPNTDFDADRLTIKYELNPLEEPKNYTVQAEILNERNKVIIKGDKESKALIDSLEIDMNGRVDSWTPDQPNLYKVRLSIFDGDQIQDQVEFPYGKKKFVVDGKKFYLNDKLITARAASVVWHRWVRNADGAEIGWDYDWFEKNIILRLKKLGANTLRFHLGNPPEKILELCDKHGLLVQYEWIFFHGMSASEESLNEQWPSWFDLGMRHPSVAIYHPYNETYGEQLEIAWNALNKIVPQYQEIALEERDILHLHKYWWSLFENVGVYYESADEFPKAIMVDEYGGNYLDGEYEIGGYSTLPQSYLRFLGRGHTKEMRKVHHTLASAKISEYWRQLGAAGFSPFCALGSWEDGNHWFEGPIKEGNPKPVWGALASSYSPVSVSMKIWDRNFYPEQSIPLELYLFNELEDQQELKVNLSVENAEGVISSQELSYALNGKEVQTQKVDLKLPSNVGEYTLKAQLINPPAEVTSDVVSTWEININQPQVDSPIKKIKIAVDQDEKELLAFLDKFDIEAVAFDDKDADLIVGSRKTWIKLASGSNADVLEKFIDNGKSVLLLDVGDVGLGQGYVSAEESMAFLQGVPRLTEKQVNTYSLFKGISLVSTEAAEPESHIHPSLQDSSLWNNLVKDAGWLWNGYKGGLNVPATDMKITGLNSKAFLNYWKSKGGDANAIGNGPYYAYELQGYFRFSNVENDQKTMNELRAFVKFEVEDAPALSTSVNPKASIIQHNLNKLYKSSKKGSATQLTPLVNAGKDLVRLPVVKIEFGKNEGQLILSQLLTEGRLYRGGTKKWTEAKVDPAAQQMVLNMISNLTE